MKVRFCLVIGLFAVLSLISSHQSETTWRLPYGDEKNSGFAHLPIKAPLSLFWYFLPTEQIKGNRFSAIHDGKQIYLSTANTLICLEMLGGERKWEKTLSSVLSTSPIFVNGKVFVGTTKGEVLSFDADTGAQGQTINFRRTIQTAITALTEYQGMLFVGTSDGYIHLFPLNGENQKSISFGYTVTTNFTLGQQKQDVFLCLGATAQRLFIFKLTALQDGGMSFREHARPSMPPGGNMTDAVYDPQTKSLFIGSNDYLVQVSISKGFVTNKLRVKGALKAKPTLAPDGTLFVGTDAGIVYAISAQNLSVKWKTEIHSPIQAPILATGEFIWVVSFEGQLLGLKSETGEIVWRFRLADVNPNFTSVSVLAPISATPFGFYVTDVNGHIYAFTDPNVSIDATPPIFRQASLILPGAQRKLVSYRLYEDASFQETPEIPGQAPIYLQVQLRDHGTGIEEDSLKAYLLEIGTKKITYLNGKFNVIRGVWSLYIHTDPRHYQPVSRQGTPQLLAPLPDGEYVVVLQAGDYAGNRREIKFAFRVNNALQPPDVQASQASAGGPQGNKGGGGGGSGW